MHVQNFGSDLDMDIPRCIAGIFAGAGGLLLIYLEHYEAGICILSSMMAFFVGEKNGQRQTPIN